MRASRTGLAALFSAGCIAAGNAQGATTQSIFHVGNSLTNYVVGSGQLANDASQIGVNLNYGLHIRCSSPLETMWDMPHDTCVDPGQYGYFDQALPNNQWDYVTLQVHYDNLTSVQPIISDFISLTRQNPANANTKFFIYQGWCQALQGQDYSARWLSAYDPNDIFSMWTRDFFNQLMPAVVAQHPELSVPIKAIPSGELFYRLDQMSEGGLLPGVTGGIEQWYGDPYHMTTPGNWAAEMAMFGTVFNTTPIGLPHPAEVTDAEAAVIQEVAWDTVNGKTFAQWKNDQNGSWSSTSMWYGGVPDGPGAVANLTSAIYVPRTINLDSPRTVGLINFNNSASYTISGGSTLSLAGASLPVTVNVAQGNHTISAPVQPLQDATFSINNGSLTLTNLQPSTGTLTMTGTGTLSVNNVRANALVVSSGLVRILPGQGAAGVSRVNGISFSAIGKLDLADNKLITKSAVGTWNGVGYSGVTGLIVSGKGSSNSWSGSSGIVTSQSAAVGSNFTTIGVAQASDVRPATATATATWAGQTLTGTDTLVMYTYGGDANLDGKITIDDYIRIDNGIAGGLSGWSNGDFNYDGKVNIDDYTVIDATVATQGPAFDTTGSAAPDAGLAAVPEPASVAALIIGSAAAASLLRRRRAPRRESSR